jgi:hypothetical protein
MLQYGMLKTKAIELLGGTITATAEAIGITYQAVNQWPDELPPRIADRVYAVWGKKNMPELAPSIANTAQTATEAVANQGA